MAATQHYYISNFSFQDGTTLPSVSVAYRDINPSAEKTALVVTCFRGRLPNTCTFATGALKNHRVIVVALFGNGESSSPSNTPGFPSTVDYPDCVRAQHQLLLDGLKVSTLDVVMGFSMGGQTTYHWTMMYPDMVKNAIIICSSAKTSGHNRQFLEGPKAALENSADYVPVELRTSATPACVRGIRAFGKAYSAWLTSADWFDQQQYASLGFGSQSAWDEVTTGANYNGWDADDLLAMLGMWQRGDITALSMEATLEASLAKINIPVLLMPCKSDQYFRWEASKRESQMITNAIFRPIPSVWGHIGGSGACKEDTQWMDNEISLFLGN